MKTMTLWLEPELPGLEVVYRQYYLQQDIDQVVTGILVWVLPYLALTFSDRLVFGSNPVYFRLFAVRMVYLLLSLFIVYLLKKYVRSAVVFDWLVLLWSVSTLAGQIAIDLTQPVNYPSIILISLVGVFSFYVFIPNTFILRVAPPIIYSLYVFLSMMINGSEISPAFVGASVFAFVITNLVGILFSARLYVSRRQEFLARHEEEKTRAELQRLASIDSLTGVYNRRRLLELAGDSLYRYKRYQRPFSILMMDLDGFKNLNDTLGHQQGDDVLIQFAEAVDKEKREADAFGRMGGDEFCLVMPETKGQSAAALASRIIKRCEELAPGKDALVVNLTVSIGISEVQPEDQTLDTLLSRSDAALYIAKNEGRNRWKFV